MKKFERVYLKGVYDLGVKRGTPDFVLGRVSLNREEFDSNFGDLETVNFNVMRTKAGKLTFVQNKVVTEKEG